MTSRIVLWFEISQVYRTLLGTNWYHQWAGLYG